MTSWHPPSASVGARTSAAPSSLDGVRREREAAGLDQADPAGHPQAQPRAREVRRPLARRGGGGDDRAPKLKQLAIANRAAGLTLPQFLDLWRSRAGRVGAVPIPEAFRGLAYVQNHPQAEPGRDWAYDAINEVYFEEIDDLLARIAYFERELSGPSEDDLVSANWFLAVREEPIP